MTDQFETESRILYSGSYTDNVYYGNISRVDSNLSGGFVRERIGSAAKQAFNNAVYNKKNLTFVQRLSFTSGSHLRGVSQIRYNVNFSPEESFFDSFLPNPVDIASTNGVVFPYIGDTGSLQGSNLHGIQGVGDNSISLFLGDTGNYSVNESSTILDEIVDFNWSISKWPFRSKYKNLNRIFTPSVRLPNEIEQTKDFDGNVVTPTSKSNILGSVYYVADKKIKPSFLNVYSVTSESNGINIKQIPTPSVSGTVDPEISDLDVTVSPDPSGSNNYPVYVGVGEDEDGLGIVFTSKQENGLESGLLWTLQLPSNTGISEQLNGIAHSVDHNSPDPFYAWVAVGDNGAIYTNYTREAAEGSWVDRSGTTANTLSSIAFNDPTGFDSTGNFAAVGAGGTVVTSSDRSGASWESLSGLPSVNDLAAITYATTAQRFVAAGTKDVAFSPFRVTGSIWQSDDRVGSNWTEVETTDGTQWFGAAAKDNTVIVVGGDAGTVPGSPQILRSNDGGATWTDETPGSVEGFLNDVAVGVPGSGIDWIAVGEAGLVLISKNDGQTWEQVASTFLNDEANNNLNTVIGTSINAQTNEFASGSRHIIARNAVVDQAKNVLFRSTNLISNEFTTGSNGQLINEIALMQKGTPKIGRFLGVTDTALNFEEIYKQYFGTGDGINITFPEASVKLFGDSNENTYMRKMSPGIYDYSIVNPNLGNLSAESIKTYGSRIRGWGYGVLNGSPVSTKVIWRQGKYGQFRDMLEQRLFSKFLNTPEGGGQSTGTSPVNVRFVSGTLSHSRAQVYLTASNPGFNPTDSGQFDYEYRAGQPYFDNINLSNFR